MNNAINYNRIIVPEPLSLAKDHPTKKVPHLMGYPDLWCKFAGEASSAQ